MKTEFKSQFYFDNSKITADEKINITLLINEIMMTSIRDKKNLDLQYYKDEFLNMIYGWFDGVCYTKMTSIAVTCFGFDSQITKRIAVMVLTAQELQK